MSRVPGLTTGNAVKKGWLLKRADHITDWRKRYFVLYDLPPRLVYYRNFSDPEPSNTIDLTYARVDPLPSTRESRHMFQITIAYPKKKTYKLAATSMLEAESWITQLQCYSKHAGTPFSSDQPANGSFLTAFERRLKQFMHRSNGPAGSPNASQDESASHATPSGSPQAHPEHSNSESVPPLEAAQTRARQGAVLQVAPSASPTSKVSFAAKPPAKKESISNPTPLPLEGDLHGSLQQLNVKYGVLLDNTRSLSWTSLPTEFKAAVAHSQSGWGGVQFPDRLSMFEHPFNELMDHVNNTSRAWQFVGVEGTVRVCSFLPAHEDPSCHPSARVLANDFVEHAISWHNNFMTTSAKKPSFVPPLPLGRANQPTPVAPSQATEFVDATTSKFRAYGTANSIGGDAEHVNRLKFSLQIDAPAELVYRVLLDLSHRNQWDPLFKEGSVLEYLDLPFCRSNAAPFELPKLPTPPEPVESPPKRAPEPVLPASSSLQLRRNNSDEPLNVFLDNEVAVIHPDPVRHVQSVRDRVVHVPPPKPAQSLDEKSNISTPPDSPREAQVQCGAEVVHLVCRPRFGDRWLQTLLPPRDFCVLRQWRVHYQHRHALDPTRPSLTLGGLASGPVSSILPPALTRLNSQDSVDSDDDNDPEYSTNSNLDRDRYGTEDDDEPAFPTRGQRHGGIHISDEEEDMADPDSYYEESPTHRPTASPSNVFQKTMAIARSVASRNKVQSYAIVEKSVRHAKCPSDDSSGVVRGEVAGGGWFIQDLPETSRGKGRSDRHKTGSSFLTYVADIRWGGWLSWLPAHAQQSLFRSLLAARLVGVQDFCRQLLVLCPRADWPLITAQSPSQALFSALIRAYAVAQEEKRKTSVSQSRTTPVVRASTMLTGPRAPLTRKPSDPGSGFGQLPSITASAMAAVPAPKPAASPSPSPAPSAQPPSQPAGDKPSTPAEEGSAAPAQPQSSETAVATVPAAEQSHASDSSSSSTALEPWAYPQQKVPINDLLEPDDDDDTEFGLEGLSRSKKGGLQFNNEEEVRRQKGVLTHLIKSMGSNLLEGKSIISISLPVRIFEPRSFLQRLTDIWAFTPIYLTRASMTTDPVERLKFTATAVVSGLYRGSRQLKPFNPILGETFQASYPDGSEVYCEQVSHHPPISGFQLMGPNNIYMLSGRHEYRAQFRANAIIGQQIGDNVVSFLDGTEIHFELPHAYLEGMLWGDRVMYWIGTVKMVDPKNKICCEMAFNPDRKSGLSSFISSQKTPSDTIRGEVYAIDESSPSGRSPICSVEGSWLQELRFGEDVYWRMRQYKPLMLRQLSGDKVLPSDCQFREDLVYLSMGDLDRAQEYKEILENRQRGDRKLRDTFTKMKTGGKAVH